ncbi:MAG: hypothetical protein P8P40_02490 [Sulfitobacter sp.]|jgi:hypothetical protein|nr:hypothetical protein [Sulfitobacter sp.]
MRRAFVILGLVSAFTFSAPVKADITKWKNVGWWTVNLYSADAGCSAFTEFEGGTSFFIGLTGTDPLILEILLYNDKWKSIQSRKEYSVTAKFGDETRWDMSMTGLANSEAKGLSLREAANSDKAGLLVEEFMRELNMTWTYDGNSLGNFWEYPELCV